MPKNVTPLPLHSTVQSSVAVGSSDPGQVLYEALLSELEAYASLAALKIQNAVRVKLLHKPELDSMEEKLNSMFPVTAEEDEALAREAGFLPPGAKANPPPLHPTTLPGQASTYGVISWARPPYHRTSASTCQPTDPTVLINSTNYTIPSPPLPGHPSTPP